MSVLSQQMDELHMEVAELPITEEMEKIVAGTKVSDNDLQALRMLAVDQCKSIIERYVRIEFRDFYEKEILKARKMGMKLSNMHIDSKTGKPLLKASETFLRIMHKYFTNLAAGQTNSGRGRRIIIDSVDKTNVNSAENSDSDASVQSFYIIPGESQKKSD